jgi:hypothetical protein
MCSAESTSSRTTPEPTVPRPTTPTLTGSGMKPRDSGENTDPTGGYVMAGRTAAVPAAAAWRWCRSCRPCGPESPRRVRRRRLTARCTTATPPPAARRSP